MLRSGFLTTRHRLASFAVMASVMAFLCGSAGMKSHSILAGTVNEIIMDNGSVGTFGEGNWKASILAQPYGKDAFYAKYSGNYSFIPQLAPGQYRVYLWWTSYKSLGDRVPVVVQTAQGAVNLQVDQRVNASRWNLLGTFDLDSSAALRLYVTSKSIVCADAAKFEPVLLYPDPFQDPPPASPTGLLASGLIAGIQLVWTSNTEPDLAFYSVYRSTTASGGYTLLGSQLTSNSYADSAVAAGTTYYYLVTATDSGGHESTASSVVSAQLVSLSPPPISLAWMAPTANVDGTPLTDLGGFKAMDRSPASTQSRPM